MIPIHQWLRSGVQKYKWHHLLPQTRWGDAWHAHLHCLRYNGHWPRLERASFNDFLAYFKSSPEIDRPIRGVMSDKFAVKQVIAHRLGAQFCVPTLALLYTPAQIDQFVFPQRCVIKPTHLSGQIIYREAGETIDLQRVMRWLRMNHYSRNRERNYRDVRPGVIVEPWLDVRAEYKIFCWRGSPRVIGIIQDFERCCLDADGCDLGFMLRGDSQSVMVPLPLPPCWPQLLQAARAMSQGLLFARVDLYDTPAGSMVGEVTHVPRNGAFDVVPQQMQDRFDRTFFGVEQLDLRDIPELGLVRN